MNTLYPPIPWDNFPWGNFHGYVEYLPPSVLQEDGEVLLTNTVTDALNNAAMAKRSVMGIRYQLPPDPNRIWNIADRLESQLGFGRRTSDIGKSFRPLGFDRYLKTINDPNINWFFTIIIWGEPPANAQYPQASFQVNVTGFPLLSKRDFYPNLTQNYLIPFANELENALHQQGIM